MLAQQLPLDSAARVSLGEPAMPHVVLEPTTLCDVRCPACGVGGGSMLRPLEAVLRDVDRAAERRDLVSISLSGGEPVLHPELPAIVRHIKQRGLVCELRTNGVRALYHDDTLALDAALEAGVDRVLVHVDGRHQHLHGDVDAARHRLCALLDDRGARFTLDLRLMQGEEQDLPWLLRDYTRYAGFDGVRATLDLDADEVFEPTAQHLLVPDLRAVARSVREELGLNPAAWLPSSLRDDDVTWLVWVAWLDPDSGRALPVAVDPDEALRLVYATDRLPGIGVPDPLRLLVATVREPPRYDPVAGAVRICRHCPEAVVHAGHLWPSCLGPMLPPHVVPPPSAVAAISRHLAA